MFILDEHILNEQANLMDLEIVISKIKLVDIFSMKVDFLS